ncbi:MAG: hypothetical protein ACQEQV_07540 [Fibrobacterota bacterium]
MNGVIIRERRNYSLDDFFDEHGFFYEKLSGSIYHVTRTGEEDVFVSVTGDTIFFEVDLGAVGDIRSQEFYAALLDLNTEILPVSLGLDTTDGENRLVIVESREVKNLDKNEMLAVFDALNIAVMKTEKLVYSFMKEEA